VTENKERMRQNRKIQRENKSVEKLQMNKERELEIDRKGTICNCREAFPSREAYETKQTDRRSNIYLWVL